MRLGFAKALAPALGMCCAVAVYGCGSGTKTVTVTATPGAEQSRTATAGAQTNTTKSSTTGTSIPQTTSTRAAPEPAFTEPETHAEGVDAAAAVVRAHGFTPNSPSEYHSNQTLRVLLATRTGSGDGYGQQAFFFLGGHYLGTDTKEPSATLKLVSQGDTEVAIAYPLYRHDDPLCCPGGGQAVVHFQLNNGKLAALDPIPPARSKSTLSRN